MTPLDDQGNPPTRLTRPDPLARLGLWTVTHRGWVFGVWAVLIIGLGAAAPTVFSLSLIHI